MNHLGNSPDVSTPSYTLGVGSGEGLPYFLDPALKQRLDLLQHLTEYADLLLVVKGERGVGKTALLQQLLERARDHWMTCVVTANPLTTRDQLLSEFGHQLGLDLRSVEFDELQAVIEERLAALQRAGRVVLLIVDDAHALAVPVLDLIMHLFGLRGEAGKLVRVLLFAEPALDETLQSPALRSLRQQVTHTLDVAPFTPEQTGEFLAHYFRASERGDQLPLPPAAIQHAYDQSTGNPAAILALAPTLSPIPEADAAKTAERRPWRFPWLLHPRMLLVAAVAVVLVLTLLFQGSINQFVADGNKEIVETDKPGVVPLPLPAPEERSPEPALPAPPPVTGRLPKVEEPPAPSVEAAAPATETTTVKPEPVAKAETTPLIAEPKPSPQRETAAVDEAPQAVATKADEPAVPAKAAAQSQPAMLGNAWLASRLPNHYTLQLMGMRDKSALLSFVAEHHLENKVAYWHTTYQGKDWHVLLFGDFVDREAAVAERTRLVRTLRGVKPWPRPFAGIQELLHRP